MRRKVKNPLCLLHLTVRVFVLISTISLILSYLVQANVFPTLLCLCFKITLLCLCFDIPNIVSILPRLCLNILNGFSVLPCLCFRNLHLYIFSSSYRVFVSRCLQTLGSLPQRPRLSLFSGSHIMRIGLCSTKSAQSERYVEVVIFLTPEGKCGRPKCRP